MNRADLAQPDLAPIVAELDALIRAMEARGVHPTSWCGTLPSEESPETRADDRANRGADYQPWPGAANDERLPWYLYWEIVWMLGKGPAPRPGDHVLDVGGSASLFSCLLASRGCEVHSIDINPHLIGHSDRIAQVMGWDLIAYGMDARDMGFEDGYFNAAYSICVFEHLDADIKRDALNEIARVLKPAGILGLTFDYKNPAPCIADRGYDLSERNRLSTPGDIERSLWSCPQFERLSPEHFHDDGTTWLVHPALGNAPYTFGATFQRRR